MRPPLLTAALAAALVASGSAFADEAPAGASTPQPNDIVVPAQASSAPAPSTQAPPIVDKAVEHETAGTHFTPSIEGGYSFQSIYAIPIEGFGFTAIGGIDVGERLRVGGIADAIFGRTDGGLRTTTTNLGLFAEARLGRFRAGGGLRLGTCDIVRATTSGGLFSLSAGGYVRVSLDLIEFHNASRGALFLSATGTVDSPGAGALFGVGAGLGVRL